MSFVKAHRKQFCAVWKDLEELWGTFLRKVETILFLDEESEKACEERRDNVAKAVAELSLEIFLRSVTGTMKAVCPERSSIAAKIAEELVGDYLGGPHLRNGEKHVSLPGVPGVREDKGEGKNNGNGGGGNGDDGEKQTRTVN